MRRERGPLRSCVTEPARTSKTSRPSGSSDNASRSSLIRPTSIGQSAFATSWRTLRRMVTESHLTPQFSGRVLPSDARRERIMKWSARGVAAMPCDGPLQLLVRRLAQHFASQLQRYVNALHDSGAYYCARHVRAATYLSARIFQDAINADFWIAVLVHKRRGRLIGVPSPANTSHVDAKKTVCSLRDSSAILTVR